MPEVQDYQSGEILNMVKKGFNSFKLIKTPILGAIIKNKLLKELNKCAPLKVDVDYAVELIRSSKTCAVGERVCNALHPDSQTGASVFLDELAIAMIEAGKAKAVQKDAAIATISRKSKYPIVITKVSGKYMELCRSVPKNCLYWNSEKRGLKCITRKKPFPPNVA